MQNYIYILAHKILNIKNFKISHKYLEQLGKYRSNKKEVLNRKQNRAIGPSNCCHAPNN